LDSALSAVSSCWIIEVLHSSAEFMFLGRYWGARPDDPHWLLRADLARACRIPRHRCVYHCHPHHPPQSPDHRGCAGGGSFRSDPWVGRWLTVVAVSRHFSRYQHACHALCDHFSSYDVSVEFYAKLQRLPYHSGPLDRPVRIKGRSQLVLFPSHFFGACP